MCAKAKLTTGSIPSDGCYKEKVSEGYQREMCVCKSSNGIYPPCNGSTTFVGYFTSILVCILFTLTMRVLE